MVVIIEVMPKEGILDPQGATVKRALHQLGYNEVDDVKVGKRIRLELDTQDETEALKRGEEMAEKLLHNPNVEAYRVKIVEEVIQ